MRTIERTTRFKKDFKRETRGRYRETLDYDVGGIVDALAHDRPLSPSNKDHGLVGWDGCRDCHVKPDLVLIYEKPDEMTLRLVRLGSHAELFG